ncbi:MAG: hypothetical protein F6J95_026175 [Leptolyngbya sp. SIO1E4]|nr:hypothetical protein [Leptolyngbya sp. SIO1E4]
MYEPTDIFEIPTPGRFPGTYLAQVVSVSDPENQGRVQVKLLSFDAAPNQDAAIWARVAVPFAGSNRGAFLIPDVEDEVLVSFVNGDSRFPIVVGGLWNGRDRPPETLPGESVDRWTLVGKAGTRIAIVEESEATATISFTTPQGIRGTFTDEGGGKIEFQTADTTITVDSDGVTVDTPIKVTVRAGSLLEITADTVDVTSNWVNFSGTVQCDTLFTNSVISAKYTPGVGNIW